jgi:CheY-like chemotaxis protein
VHVLLAEDDRAVRESRVRALTLEGYDVRAVSNGALEALRAATADLPTRPRLSPVALEPARTTWSGWTVTSIESARSASRAVRSKIVRDVAERHGRSVFARNREGGGAVVGFRLGV